MLLYFSKIYFIYRSPGSLPVEIQLALVLLIILILSVKSLSRSSVVPLSLKLLYNDWAIIRGIIFFADLIIELIVGTIIILLRKEIF